MYLFYGWIYSHQCLMKLIKTKKLHSLNRWNCQNNIKQKFRENPKNRGNNDTPLFIVFYSHYFHPTSNQTSQYVYDGNFHVRLKIVVTMHLAFIITKYRLYFKDYSTESSPHIMSPRSASTSKTKRKNPYNYLQISSLNLIPSIPHFSITVIKK